MNSIFTIIILLGAVVIANVIHLVWSRVPLSVYQILAGIIIALLPTSATDITLHPELFMMVVIAPLMFNDGQNQSSRVLSRNIKNIFSLSVLFAVVTVLIMGLILHGTLGSTFSLPLAFLLAAIITPTDAVAVKSLTGNVTMPENVNTTLEVESLFNDASGIVLLDLSLAAYESGQFSLGHGIWYFSYVFFGGIIFGLVAGSCLISLRTALMRNHVDIASIVIPMNVMTPVVIYWCAEELHLSGILAVVAAGVVHSILYDRLRLTSTKVQIATTTIWAIISDALNGIVFVLLGMLLPQVVRRTPTAHLLFLLMLAGGLYLIMFFCRFAWSRLKLVNMKSASKALTKDSWLLALGGVHGTITLSLALSLPIMINNSKFAYRNAIISISAFVILISIIVSAIVYPLILPAKASDYSPEDFRDWLTKTVQYAINELRSNTDDPYHCSLVTDQLNSQMTQFYQINRATFNKLVQKAHQIELDTINQLAENDQLAPQAVTMYTNIINRSFIRHSQHGFMASLNAVIHRLKWRLTKHHHLRRHVKLRKPNDDHMGFVQTFELLTQRVFQYLDRVQSADNLHEVAMVRRSYLQRMRILSRDQGGDQDKIAAIFVEGFQLEHSYVQEKLAANKIPQSLANALNEQISTDELVYVQSLD